MISRIRSGFILLSVGAAMLCGCLASSPPSRFYTLSSLREANAAAAQPPSAGEQKVLAVGPIQVPDYLDRPEIVSRSGEHENILNQFDRWSGSLESCISRATTENLSVLLPTGAFSVVRWSPSQTDMPLAYRVMVDVERFDSSPGGTALLDADWAIYGNNKQIALMRKSRVSEKVRGPDFTDVAAAMSKAVEGLSRDIAAGVAELERKAAPVDGERTPASDRDNDTNTISPAR